MIQSAATQPDQLLNWMDSLADPTRLRLVRLLERQELGVAELCAVLQMPQSTVSRHLKVLTERGWLRNRRSGTTNLYRAYLNELDDAAQRLWSLAREQTADWATFEQDALRLQQQLQQRKAGPKSFFTGAADDWDAMRCELYGHEFLDMALAALTPADWTVADLGCGTGRVAGELAPHVKHVIGIDNTPAMVKAAKERTQSLTNVTIRKGELEALPIDDAVADAGLMVLVLTYVAEVQTALAEAARVIRPGGRLVMIDLLHHDREDFRRELNQLHMGFEPDELTEGLKRAGFAKVHCQPLPPQPDAKGPALLLATADR